MTCAKPKENSQPEKTEFVSYEQRTRQPKKFKYSHPAMQPAAMRKNKTKHKNFHLSFSSSTLNCEFIELSIGQLHPNTQHDHNMQQ